MSVTLSGFDDLQREMEEVQQAMAALNGTVAHLKLTSDPDGIQTAIQQMEAAVDRKLAAYRHNSMVAGVAEDAKKQFRQEILEWAAGKP